jgi:hypothetical protein
MDCKSEDILSINDLFSSKFKFSPPKPSYKIISEIKDSSSLYNNIECEILSSMPFNKYDIPDWIKVSFHSINYKKNKSIICMHIENNYSKRQLSSKKVILYSHENNTDLIRLLPFLVDLSIQNKCNIISYDYRGFGCSSSKSNAENFISSYEYTMNYTLNYLKYKVENILIIGRGIGAIHSVIIASRHKYNMCKGLILISPIINEEGITNINIMKSIICPTLLIKEKIENDDKEDKSILFYRQINDEKEWLLKNKNIYENNSLFYEKDFLLSHRKKFINYIREYMKSNNDDKNISTYSRKSTNVETFNSEFDYLENQNDDKCDNNKNNEESKNTKKNYMKEFEEEDDNINYNNDDY